MTFSPNAFDNLPPDLRAKLLQSSHQFQDTIQIEEQHLESILLQHPCTHSAAPPQPSRGLGDIIHTIIYPIAAAADTLLGTDLQNCPTCAQRQAALNTLFQI